MAPPKKKLAGAAAAAAAKAGQGNPPPAAAAAIAVKPELIAGSIFQRFPFQVVPKRDVKGRDCKAAKAKSRNSLPSKDPSSSQPPTKVVRLPVTYRSLPLVRLSRRWPAFHLASTPGLGAQSGSLLDRVDNCLHLVFFPGEYQDFTSFAHQVRRAERHKTEKALPFPVGHVPVLQGLVRANYLNRNSGSSSNSSKNKSVQEAPPLPRELALFTANGPMVVKIRTLEEVGGKGHPAYQHYDESDDAKMLHLCLVPRECTVKKSSSSSSESSESSSETSSIASNSQANGGNGGAEPRLLADWEEDHRAEREPGIEDLIRGNQQQNAVIFGHMRHNMMQHFAHRLRRGAGGVFVGGGGPGAARAGGAGGAEPPRRAPPALPLLPLAREERLFERPNVRRLQLPDMPRPPPPQPQLQMVIQAYPAPAPAPAPAAAPAAAPALAPAPALDAPPPPPRPLPPGLNGLHPQELNRQRLLELNLRSRPLLRRNSRAGGQVAPAAAPTVPPPPQQNVNSG